MRASCSSGRRSSGAARPEDIANALLFLASEAVGLHHRPELNVDGGWVMH